MSSHNNTQREARARKIRSQRAEIRRLSRAHQMVLGWWQSRDAENARLRREVQEARAEMWRRPPARCWFCGLVASWSRFWARDQEPPQ